MDLFDKTIVVPTTPPGEIHLRLKDAETARIESVFYEHADTMVVFVPVEALRRIVAMAELADG